eukprot:TRINITY_DN23421_c0_g1_i1.p1 TRINITY_DN23421_c0_g1~~TRINITY_DN23421_c0_g1_i1.p1  ORF type:complete len:541 (+),score=154.08 TRINITY_DN23421_c0_g1_i1:146-1624(+)
MARLAAAVSGVEGVRVLLPTVNSAAGTWAPQHMRWMAQNRSNDGVTRCGMRLARYIVDNCDPPCYLSLACHSFGGLVAREAVRLLRLWADQAAARGHWKLKEAMLFRPAAEGGVEMGNFITFATPHLGSWHGAAPLQSAIIGATGEDISLYNDVLLDLATSEVALRALQGFRNVVFYGCVENDACVPCYSALATMLDGFPDPRPPGPAGEALAEAVPVCWVADEPPHSVGCPGKVRELVWREDAAVKVLRMLAALSRVHIRRIPVFAPVGGHQVLIAKEISDPTGEAGAAVVSHFVSWFLAEQPEIAASVLRPRDTTLEPTPPRTPLVRQLCAADPRVLTAKLLAAAAGDPTETSFWAEAGRPPQLAADRAAPPPPPQQGGAPGEGADWGTVAQGWVGDIHNIAARCTEAVSSAVVGGSREGAEVAQLAGPGAPPGPDAALGPRLAPAQDCAGPHQQGVAGTGHAAAGQRWIAAPPPAWFAALPQWGPPNAP